ncbi:MAG: ribosome maturation factor RimM [Saprospiraceae bacterium]|nr:ribosome maturation factor RimM [Saprospiraceae bacterium]
MRKPGSRWETIQTFTSVGVLGKAYGAGGEIRIRVDDAFLDRVMSAQFLFVRRSGSYVPYEVEGWRTARGLVVKLYGIDDAGAAALVAGDEVSLAGRHAADLTIDADGLTYAHLIGFTVSDATLGELSVILDIQAYPQQEMAVISYQDKQVLIPLNPTFILHIDPQQRIISVDLPDGLLDQ